MADRRRYSDFERQFARLCSQYGGSLRHWRATLYIIYLIRGRL